MVTMHSHDLIQEQVLTSIPAEERKQLHHNIGVALASKTPLDIRTEHRPIDAALDQLYLSGDGSGTDNENDSFDVSMLIRIATSQINNAGPDFFVEAQRTRFASWNLRAGNLEVAEHSSFRAALYYYQDGISFLGDKCGDGQLWLRDDTLYELRLKLYEGAAFSSSALGEAGLVSKYANVIIANVEFEDSLQAEHLLIGSLSATGQYKEAVARG